MKMISTLQLERVSMGLPPALQLLIHEAGAAYQDWLNWKAETDEHCRQMEAAEGEKYVRGRQKPQDLRAARLKEIHAERQKITDELDILEAEYWRLLGEMRADGYVGSNRCLID
jgi:hypothetical protein